MSNPSPIVELRRYALHPGGRETLISVFEREFIESQEECGCEVIAHFRDLDHPDTFTWFRGFDSMQSREKMLGAFYGGPVWMANRDVANATMIDSDNVWLLHPAFSGSGIRSHGVRPPRGATSLSDEIVQITVYTLKPEAVDSFPAYFSQSVVPALRATSAEPIAAYVTEHSENTFPRLPVREGEHAFVWIAVFADLAQHGAHVSAVANSQEWQDRIAPEMNAMFAAPPDAWRLSPTARSPSLMPRG